MVEYNSSKKLFYESPYECPAYRVIIPQNDKAYAGFLLVNSIWPILPEYTLGWGLQAQDSHRMVIRDSIITHKGGKHLSKPENPEFFILTKINIFHI